MRIINAHLGGGGGGVVPDGLVWHGSPSLDTAGNGTTTLTEFVAGNDGTLTNMDAGSDWVSDTDSGGVRALEFDGTNDYVNVAGSVQDELHGLSAASMSFWWKRPSGSASIGFVASNNNRFEVIWVGGVLYFTIENGALNFPYCSEPSTSWVHVVCVFDGTQGTATNRVKAWVNGSQKTLTGGTGSPTTLSSAFTNFRLGRDNSNRYQTGRVDAVRLYNRALTTDEIATLYDSGNGRGIA